MNKFEDIKREIEEYQTEARTYFYDYNQKLSRAKARYSEEVYEQDALVNKNWTQILNFFTIKIDFLCNAIDLLIHPCLAGRSVSGMERL